MEKVAQALVFPNPNTTISHFPIPDEDRPALDSPHILANPHFRIVFCHSDTPLPTVHMAHHHSCYSWSRLVRLFNSHLIIKDGEFAFLLNPSSGVDLSYCHPGEICLWLRLGLVCGAGKLNFIHLTEKKELRKHKYGNRIFRFQMFGSLVSATDPVAVVALLKEVGKMAKDCIAYRSILLRVFLNFM